MAGCQIGFVTGIVGLSRKLKQPAESQLNDTIIRATKLLGRESSKSTIGSHTQNRTFSLRNLRWLQICKTTNHVKGYLLPIVARQI